MHHATSGLRGRAGVCAHVCAGGYALRAGLRVTRGSAGYARVCGLRAGLRVTRGSAGYARVCGLRAGLRVQILVGYGISPSAVPLFHSLHLRFSACSANMANHLIISSVSYLSGSALPAP